MPKGWLQNNESSVEEESEMSYLEYDDVKAAQHAYRSAVAEFDALQAEHKKYSQCSIPTPCKTGRRSTRFNEPMLKPSGRM